MKKGTLLNSEISAVIATMGHTDSICIADCGLPIPSSVKRIDISVVKGLPSFIATLDAILAELEVEEAILASELVSKAPDFYNALKEKLGNIPIHLISHEDFKAMTAQVKACVRTGEYTPYANIILKSGVTF